MIFTKLCKGIFCLLKKNKSSRDPGPSLLNATLSPSVHLINSPTLSILKRENQALTKFWWPLRPEHCEIFLLNPDFKIVLGK